MNHEFQPNNSIPDKCTDCGYPSALHGPNAVCQCCSNTGTLEFLLLGMETVLACRDCIAREKAAELDAEVNSVEGRRKTDEYQSPDKQQARLDEYNKVAKPYEQLIANARRIDEQVHLSTDIFNAKTVSIKEIHDAIMADESISADEKHFELARVCKERILHFQTVIFELDKKKIEAYSEQKSWHIQLNDLANRLRTEQREQLRISDIHYDVKLPKVVTPRAIKTSPKKASKDELRKLAEELKMPEFTIQLIMTSKNWTLEQAGNHLRRTIKEGASMSAPKESEKTDEPNDIQ